MLSSSNSSDVAVEDVKDPVDFYLSPASLESFFREFHRKINRQYSARIFTSRAPLAELESCSFHILPEIPDNIMNNDKYRNSYVWQINTDITGIQKHSFDHLSTTLWYQMRSDESGGDLKKTSDTTVNLRLRLDSLIAEFFNGKMPVFIRLDGTCENIFVQEKIEVTDEDNTVDENSEVNKKRFGNEIFSEFVRFFRDIVIDIPRLSFDKFHDLVLLLKPETLRRWITEPTGHSPIMANTIAKTIAYYRKKEHRDVLRSIYESSSGNPVQLIEAISASVKLQAHAAVLDITIRQFINTLLSLPLVLEDLNVQANRIRDKIDETIRKVTNSKNKDEVENDLQRYKQNLMLVLFRTEEIENLRVRVNAAFFIKTHLPGHFKDPVLNRAGLDFRKELLKLVKSYLALGISKTQEQEYLGKIYQALGLDKKAIVQRQREGTKINAKKIITANKNKNDNLAYALSAWGRAHRLEALTNKIIQAVTNNEDLFAEILKDMPWTNELIDRLFSVMFPRTKFAISGHELKIAASDTKKLKGLVGSELPDKISTADKSVTISNPYQAFMDIFTNTMVLGRTDIRRICMAASNISSMSMATNKQPSLLSSTEKLDSSSSSPSVPVSQSSSSMSRPVIFHEIMPSKKSISLSSSTSTEEDDLFEDEKEYEENSEQGLHNHDSSVVDAPQHFTSVQHKDIFAMLTSSNVIKHRSAAQGSLILAGLYNKAGDDNFLSALTELITKFNFTHQMLERISNMIKAITAINQLMKFPNLAKSITNIMLNLQGRYVAHYFLNIIHDSNMSDYEYILSTAKTPGLCVEHDLKKEGAGELLIEMANLFGSARDILVDNQNNAPVISTLEGMISYLAEHAGWTTGERAVVDNFMNHGMQFIVNECLTSMAEVDSKNNKINYAIKCIDNFADAKGELNVVSGVANIAAMRRSLWLPDERYGDSHLSLQNFNANSKSKLLHSTSGMHHAKNRFFPAEKSESLYDHTLRQEVFDGMLEYLHELYDNGQLLPEKLRTFSLIISKIGVPDKQALLELENKIQNGVRQAEPGLSN